ncbi:MAG: PIG-L family deacetylase [Byssovorax sp.]
MTASPFARRTTVDRGFVRRAPLLSAACSLLLACGEPPLTSSPERSAPAASPTLVATSGEAADPLACKPGELEVEPCGACGSGKQTRVCTEAGRFGELGKCVGEDRRIPFDPRTKAPVCDIGPGPAVFIAPHPDDESIGMAGAILAARAKGRPVFIELMTHGEASGARRKLDDGAGDRWHPGLHEYPLSRVEFGEARVRELIDAAARLDVTGVVINDFPNGGLVDTDVLGRIDVWLARGLPGLSLAGTAGPQDPESPGGKPHPDHVAVWDALVASGADDVRGYLIYDHLAHGGHPSASVSIAPFCAQKAAALDAYGVWEPERGRYAIGFHSVRSLIHAAQKDCVELTVTP